MLSPDDLPVVPGREIAGRYRVLHRIGSGTLGLVVMALDSETDRRVALKILMPRSTTKPTDPHGKRILRKAAMKAQEFTHSGAARILATHVETVGPHPSVVLVMERQGAPSLETVLSARGRLPYPEACGIIDAVADVVEAAHEQELLHLALKPTNVFVDPRDSDDEPFTVVVTDFGLLEAARSCHQRGSPLPGSREASAPEVLVYGEVDKRADVYGLGYLLWDMLQREDDDDDYDELLVPTDEHPPVPEALLAVVERATDPDPEERYADVASFRLAVAEVVGVLDNEEEEVQRRGGAWATWLGVAVGGLVVVGACLAALWVLGVPQQAMTWVTDMRAPWSAEDADTRPAGVEPPDPHAGWGGATRTPDAPARVRPVVPRTNQAADGDAVLMPVRVVTEPAGATAWIDMEPVGQTPVVVSVDPQAPVKVLLTKSGHASKTIRLDGQQARVSTLLDPSADGTGGEPPPRSTSAGTSGTKPTNTTPTGTKPTNTTPTGTEPTTPGTRPTGSRPAGPDDLILER